MADYTTPADADELFPESGYAVVVMDTFKPPDSEDFINILSTFESADEVVIPPSSSSYSYYVHAANGDTYSREEWPPDE